MNAEIVLFSEAIFDAVRDRPFSGGIAIANSKIIGIGKKSDMNQFIDEKTVVKDMGSRLILPGFIDSHAHFTSGAIDTCSLCCDMTKAASEEECVELMMQFVKEHPGLNKYKGKNWFMANWGAEAKLPTKASLDKAFPEVPVYLIPSDGHSVWMNTKALLKTQIEEISKKYKPELVVRDSNGELTGVIREEICFEVWKCINQIPADTEKEYQKQFMKCLNQAGITGFSDVSMIPPEDLKFIFRHLKEFDEHGEMDKRLYIYPGTDLKPEGIKDIVPYNEYFNTDTLHIAGVKGVIDGVTSTYTAVLLEPYSDAPGVNGVMVTSKEQLEAWVMEANKYGYSSRLHCIGDGAVRYALDAYEKSNHVNDNKKIRNAVEHIELIHPDDIPRFHKLNVVASMQPGHLPLELGEKRYRCGERSRYEWAFHSILKAGGRIAAGTDYSVIDYNPYKNIYAGVTRKHFDGTQYGLNSLSEKMTLSEMLKAYTAEGAYVNSMEDKLGTLEVGKYADVIVASDNLFAIGEDDLKNCETVLTIFNGKITYEK